MSQQRTLKKLLLCLVIYQIFIIYATLHSKANSKTINHQLILKLSSLQSQLHKARRQNLHPPLSSLNTVKYLLTLVNPDFKTSGYKINKDQRIVCPEIFTNSTFGYPFYEKGWVRKCKHKFKVKQFVTVLLNPPIDGDCDQYITRVVKGILKRSLKINIFIGNRNKHCRHVYSDLGLNNVEEYNFKSNITEGRVWNHLINKVKTKFVILGRNIDYWTWFSGVQRQISVFSIDKSVGVVGGSVRNLTGHWKIGCFQTKMSNFKLQFIEGYYSSKNECMFCDHISSPFMATTRFLRGLKFNEKLHRGVLFEDYFWRVKTSGMNILNCPDFMYFSTDIDEQTRTSSKSMWIKFIQKYTLNSVIYPPHYKLSFSCNETGNDCFDYIRKVRYALMPPCCLESLANTLQFIDKVAKNNNLTYEIFSGTALGAVKIGGVIPWDFDADAQYLLNENDQWMMLKTTFISHGYNFKNFSSSKDYFIIKSLEDNDIDMCGLSELSTELLPIEMKGIQTKVKMGDGIWVNAVSNPGLYARNRYGVECLKHAHSWRYAGGSSAYSSYSAGFFHKCPRLTFHGCTNLFRADGNLQFLLN